MDFVTTGASQASCFQYCAKLTALWAKQSSHLHNSQQKANMHISPQKNNFCPLASIYSLLHLLCFKYTVIISSWTTYIQFEHLSDDDLQYVSSNRRYVHRQSQKVVNVTLLQKATHHQLLQHHWFNDAHHHPNCVSYNMFTQEQEWKRQHHNIQYVTVYA